MNNDLEDNIRDSQIPDIVLVKKKYNRSKGKRIWKLKHINKDDDVEMKDSKGKKDKANNKALDHEMVMRDIEEDRSLRKQVNMIKDDAAIKELLERMNTLNVDDKNDPEIDVEINELLDDLDLNDNKDDKELDYNGDDNEEQVITEKIVLGKRDRDGKIIKEKKDNK